MDRGNSWSEASFPLLVGQIHKMILQEANLQLLSNPKQK